MVRALHAALERRRGDDGARVVMGDFNALRLADYDPSELARVRAHRAASGREAPAGDVIAAMDRWGYFDAYRYARAAREAPAGDRAAAYARELARPLAPAEIPTCWAGTRIDYAWLSRYRLAVRASTSTPIASASSSKSKAGLWCGHVNPFSAFAEPMRKKQPGTCSRK